MELYGVIMAKRFSVFWRTEDIDEKLRLVSLDFDENQSGRMVEECLETARRCLAPQEMAVVESCLRESPESSWNKLCQLISSAVAFPRKKEDLEQLRSLLLQTDHCLLTFLDCALDNLTPDAAQPVLPDCSVEYETFLKSHLATQLLASAFRASVDRRAALCRDIVVLFAFVAYYKQELNFPPSRWSATERTAVPRLVNVAHQYSVLQWLSGLHLAAVKPDEMERNEPSLSCLQLCWEKEARRAESVMAALFGSRVGARIRSLLCLRLSSIERGEGMDRLPLNWGVAAEQLMCSAISACWPSGALLVVLDFFLASAQFRHLADFCDLFRSWPIEMLPMKYVYQGFAHVNLSQPEQALEHFLAALPALETPGQVLIQKLFPNKADEDLAWISTRYFLMIIDLFASRQLPEFVIRIAEEALSRATPGDPHTPKLWVILFKYYLDGERFEDALTTLHSNQDEETQDNCLRQLLVRLLEEGRRRELIRMNYGPLEDKVVELLVSRAQGCDLSRCRYYEILTAFLLHRSNFRKAATYFYEVAMRLRLEAPGIDSLQKQMEALATCQQCLSLSRPGYAWIVRPAVLCKNDLDAQGKSPKRDADGESMDGSRRRLELVELDGVRREYLVAEARHLLAVKRSLVGDSVEDLVTALLKEDLFDCAWGLAAAHSLPLAPLISALTERCIRCSVPTSKPSSTSWLEQNPLLLPRSSCNASASERCWRLLEAYLDRLSESEAPVLVCRAVAEKLLSFGYSLPVWLLSRYKRVDVGDCVRTLICFDQLLTATDVLCDYIDAVLGVDVEASQFQLQHCLRPGEGAVWLPYSVIDQLLNLEPHLHSANLEPQLRSAYSELERKLENYFKNLETLSKFNN